MFDFFKKYFKGDGAIRADDLNVLTVLTKGAEAEEYIGFTGHRSGAELALDSPETGLYPISAVMQETAPEGGAIKFKAFGAGKEVYARVWDAHSEKRGLWAKVVPKLRSAMRAVGIIFASVPPDQCLTKTPFIIFPCMRAAKWSFGGACGNRVYTYYDPHRDGSADPVCKGFEAAGEQPIVTVELATRLAEGVYDKPWLLQVEDNKITVKSKNGGVLWKKVFSSTSVADAQITPGLDVVVCGNCLEEHIEDTEDIGTGNGEQEAFSKTISNTPIVAGSVHLSAVAVNGTLLEVTDDGLGGLKGDIQAAGTNTINYDTGAISVKLILPPADGAGIPVQYAYTVDKGDLVYYDSNGVEQWTTDAGGGLRLVTVVGSGVFVVKGRATLKKYTTAGAFVGDLELPDPGVANSAWYYWLKVDRKIAGFIYLGAHYQYDSGYGVQDHSLLVRVDPVDLSIKWSTIVIGVMRDMCCGDAHIFVIADRMPVYGLMPMPPQYMVQYKLADEGGPVNPSGSTQYGFFRAVAASLEGLFQHPSIEYFHSCERLYISSNFRRFSEWDIGEGYSRGDIVMSGRDPGGYYRRWRCKHDVDPGGDSPQEDDGTFWAYYKYVGWDEVEQWDDGVTQYNAGYLVEHSDKTYRALLQHVPTSNTEPGTGMDWEIYWTCLWTDEKWSAGTAYSADDLVSYGGIVYKALRASTGAAPPPDAGNNWIRVGAYSRWAPYHEYCDDDMVRYYGKRYRCKQGHTSAPKLTPLNVAHWSEEKVFPDAHVYKGLYGYLLTTDEEPIVLYWRKPTPGVLHSLRTYAPAT